MILMGDLFRFSISPHLSYSFLMNASLTLIRDQFCSGFQPSLN
ncbi:hypothetical protein BLL52_3774 [Rhodoferax antarcticus ANT.BR]|uniref:Uncharacterized protein n=1 Tax=Rhodoferax antarcticus ANT.BR TaxID=1111071 RepID=A0A1Q8YA99_9BURK|nr:hypothetical protein BLL52_3774 [Rhodoferax antarcticus ANT.BR]